MEIGCRWHRSRYRRCHYGCTSTRDLCALSRSDSTRRRETRPVFPRPAGTGILQPKLVQNTLVDRRHERIGVGRQTIHPTTERVFLHLSRNTRLFPCTVAGCPDAAAYPSCGQPITANTPTPAAMADERIAARRVRRLPVDPAASSRPTCVYAAPTPYPSSKRVFATLSSPARDYLYQKSTELTSVCKFENSGGGPSRAAGPRLYNRPGPSSP